MYCAEKWKCFSKHQFVGCFETSYISHSVNVYTFVYLMYNVLIQFFDSLEKIYRRVFLYLV